MTNLTLPHEYSRDVWDYWRDTPGLPSRADRDRLIRKARFDGAEQRRVHLWDYFFPINPDLVGRELRREIEVLSEDITKTKRDGEEGLAANRRELELVARQRAEYEGSVQDALVRAASTVTSDLRRRAWVRLVPGILLILPALFWLLSTAFSDEGIGCGAVLVLMLVFPPGLLGIVLVIKGRKLLGKESVDRAVNEAQAEYLLSLESARRQFSERQSVYEQGLKNAEELLLVRLPGLTTRRDYVVATLEVLKRQIPIAPDAATVDEWLEADLQGVVRAAKAALSLGELGLAIERFSSEGIRGWRISEESFQVNADPILEPTSARKPLGDSASEIWSPRRAQAFVLVGPAELQGVISERSEMSGGGESDRDQELHLAARRFRKVVGPGSGESVEHYGVIGVEIFFLMSDRFARFGCRFDFIVGMIAASKSESFHYVDVVRIETETSRRRIEVGGARLDVDNVLTVRTTATDSRAAEISLPSAHYFREIWERELERFDSDFDIERAAHLPKTMADRFTRAMMANIDRAKKRLEMQQPDPDTS